MGEPAKAAQRILIVDDEEDVRLFLADFLGERDFAVETAKNGLEGLEKVKSWKPDTVLLDIMMPGMDGMDCLEAIKKWDSKISVIMITAMKDDDRIARAAELGAFEYILKPFSLSYLESQIERLLGKEPPGG